MTTREVIDTLEKAIERAEGEYEAAQSQAFGGNMTILKSQHPMVQHAHGKLNALADLRTELVARGLI